MTACLHPERFVHGILAFVPDLRVDGFGIVAFSGVSGAKTSGVSGDLSKTGRKLGNPGPGHEAGTVDPTGNSRSRPPKPHGIKPLVHLRPPPNLEVLLKKPSTAVKSLAVRGTG